MKSRPDNLYDPKCFELAAWFLLDVMQSDDPRYEKAADALAAEIQNTIDLFIEYDELMKVAP